MSNISNRPLSTDELDLIESLLSLSISGDNQGIAKVGNTSFNNITFQGGSGGGTFASITGDPYDNIALATTLDTKQVTLVSSTNIKTINGSDILGSGDLTVTGGITHPQVLARTLGA